MLADAVYRFVGRAKGLIHEIWAARRPAPAGRGGFLEEILGNLTPEMTQLVRNTFLSVREYARARWPHQTRDILDFNYTFKVTKRTSLRRNLCGASVGARVSIGVFWTDRYRRTWRRAP